MTPWFNLKAGEDVRLNVETRSERSVVEPATRGCTTVPLVVETD